ncbi:MAG: hypothetical protein JKY43_10445 [Phycisphaerales bacterium]|nr:hypothetical protein [Phycisphaerales bacterium]
MPALTTIKAPAIQSLATELSYAGKQTIIRHLERIEQLAPAIDPDGLYPQDFIIFRVTGYRQNITNPEMLPGNTLRADLSALAEHLSESANLTLNDLHPNHQSTYETIDSLAKRWAVSRKSIERYRRLGLVARRINTGSGHRSIIFLEGPVSWFQEKFKDRLGTAAEFTRMDQALTDKIIRDARRYRNRLGSNRTQITARIAHRIARSTESVRRTLIAHDEACKSTTSVTDNQPIFSMPLPAGQNQQHAMLAQSLQGKRTGTIAANFNRTPISVNRAINRARRTLIQNALFQSGFQSTTHPQPDPAPTTPKSSILTQPPVITNLTTQGPTDLTSLIEQLRTKHPAIIYEQTTRATAIIELQAQSRHLTSQLHPSTPSGRILDQIETNMRWIILLRIELVNTQLPLMLATIEQHIGGPIDTLPPSRATQILKDAIAVVDSTITTALSRHAPSSTARLAAPVSLAITHWASRLPDIATPPTQGKAARRISQGFPVENWTTQLWTQWHWLRPPALKQGFQTTTNLTDRDKELLTRRYALSGNKPQSLADLAAWLNTPPLHATRMSQAALKRAHPTT